MQINHGEEGTKFSWLNTSPPYGGYMRTCAPLDRGPGHVKPSC
jgi:hypothetical protein